MTELVKTDDEAANKIERLVMQGDLGGLSATEKVIYMKMICDRLGIDPLTQPFAYIPLNGRLTLYAKKDATDQLRKVHQISIQILERFHDKDVGVFYVRARATMPDGREDESLGAVSVMKQTGESFANSIMKAETKAKRRVTLSIMGLGFLSEAEVDDIPSDAKNMKPGVPRKVSPAPLLPSVGSVRTSASELETPMDAEYVDTNTGEITPFIPSEAKEDPLPYVPTAVLNKPPSGLPRAAGSPLPKPLPPSVAPISLKKV